MCSLGTNQSRLEQSTHSRKNFSRKLATGVRCRKRVLGIGLQSCWKYQKTKTLKGNKANAKYEGNSNSRKKKVLQKRNAISFHFLAW